MTLDERLIFGEDFARGPIGEFEADAVTLLCLRI